MQEILGPWPKRVSKVLLLMFKHHPILTATLFSFLLSGCFEPAFQTEDGLYDPIPEIKILVGGLFLATILGVLGIQKP